MSDRSVETLVWEIEIPLGDQVKVEPLRVSRSEFREVVSNTTQFCIAAITDSYDLDHEVEDALYARLASFDTRLVSQGLSEYNYPKDESLPITPLSEIVGGIALLRSVQMPETSSERATIFLHKQGISEEAAALSVAAADMLSVIQENKAMEHQDAIDMFETLKKDPQELFRISASMAYARRLLKYGLIKDQDMPKAHRERLGRDEWFTHCKNQQQRETEYSRREQQILRKIYVENDLAIKNLRYSVWTKMFYSIVGIVPERDPFFYMRYGQAIGEKPKYSITFSYSGQTCTLNDASVREGIEAIYVPKRKKLRPVK